MSEVPFKSLKEKQQMKLKKMIERSCTEQNQNVEQWSRAVEAACQNLEQWRAAYISSHDKKAMAFFCQGCGQDLKNHLRSCGSGIKFSTFE